MAEENEALTRRNKKLISSQSNNNKQRFGRKSERRSNQNRDKGTGRKRGQQKGSKGHGRAQDDLPVEITKLGVPEDQRICSSCGKPFVANGTYKSEYKEIRVSAHTRRAVRSRYRKNCQCPNSVPQSSDPTGNTPQQTDEASQTSETTSCSDDESTWAVEENVSSRHNGDEILAKCSPVEVSAPPVPSLFDRTAYGISVWEYMLYQRYALNRTFGKIERNLNDHGLSFAKGTMCSSIPRFVNLFNSISQAIRSRLAEAPVVKGDETVWRVQEHERITFSPRRTWGGEPSSPQAKDA